VAKVSHGAGSPTESDILKNRPRGVEPAPAAF
jgi:hypothetical protein